MAVVVECDLQELSGTTAVDTSGNSNDMACQNGLSFDSHSVAGPGGDFLNAIRLTRASSHYLRDFAPSAGPASGDASVGFCIWLKVRSNATRQALASWSAGDASDTNNICELAVNSAGTRFQTRTETGIALDSVDYTVDQWYHVVARFVSASDRRLVIDKVEKGSNSTNRGTSGQDRLAIGARWGATAVDFADIDAAGFVFLDSTPTQTEIDAHFDRAKPKFSASPEINGSHTVGNNELVSFGVTDGTVSYQWKLDGNPVGPDANIYAPTAPGSLTCEVTATNSIGSTLEIAPAVTITGSGVNAVVNSTLEDVTTTSAADSPIKATTGATLDDVVSTAVAASQITGQSTATLDDVTSSSAAASDITGSASATLEDVTTTSSASSAIEGSTSTTLDDVTAVSTGSATSGGTGSVSTTLDDVTSSSTSSSNITGDTAAILDDVTSASSSSSAIQGGVASTLDDVTTVSAGGSGSFGQVGALLENVVAASLASADIKGTSTGTLDNVVLISTGTVPANLIHVHQVIATRKIKRTLKVS